MKKLFALSAILLFTAFALTVEAQDSKYMFSGEFTLNFSDEVTIKVGGAKESKSAAEWEQGGKVGKHTINAKTFASIQQATSGKFKIEIEKKKVGTLHALKATDIESGKVVKGIYNDKDRKFTFGSAKSTKSSGATKTDIGVIKGQFSEDMDKINNGEFGIGFIAGNGAAVLSANAVFYFEAVPAE
jgi:hypothetical protein